MMGLARGVRRAGGQLFTRESSKSLGAQLVARRIADARNAVLDEHQSAATRAQAISVLGLLSPAQLHELAANLLEPRSPQPVQLAALQALADRDSPEVADLILARLRRFEPSVRTEAIRTLLTRAQWTNSLLESLIQSAPESGMSASLIESADRQPLLRHRDPAIARSAERLFGHTAPGSRAQVISDYAPVLRQKADAPAGANIFERECKSCHLIGDRGFAVGPDLTASPSRDPLALLSNILDPNASVPPKDVQYIAIDQNGRTYSGIIASETATSLTLRRGDGAQDTILRAQIEELTSTGLSLMPEGFEKRISKAEMANLIAFICGAHRDGANERESALDDDRSRPLDIGTLPGLIEPDE
jgi:putative heme-binding domain-containing protein